MGADRALLILRDIWNSVAVLAFIAGLQVSTSSVLASVHFSGLNAGDQVLYTRALSDADSDRWGDALRNGQLADNPVLVNYLRWRWLTDNDSTPSFSDVRDFIAKYPDWPMMSVLQRKAEERMTGDEAPEDLLKWFRAWPPRTGRGRMFMAEALLATGRKGEAEELIRDTWISYGLARSDETRLLARFGKWLRSQDHRKRLDERLWAGDLGDARFLLKEQRIDSDTRAVALARIALQERSGAADKLVRNVPRSRADDPGFVFDRMVFRRQKNLEESAAELLGHPSADKGKPDLWAKERLVLARAMLDKGNYRRAYDMVRRHAIQGGAVYADLEWLAGWIALRFLDRPKMALPHFRNVASAVSFPISVARAHYWIGRTLETLGDSTEAKKAYLRAADEPTTFYGQLAAERTGTIPSLPPAPRASGDEKETASARSLTLTALALASLGRQQEMMPFLIRLIEDAKTPGERAIALNIAREAGTEAGVAIARRAAQKGHHDLDTAYPLPDFTLPDGPEKALILAVIRQESNFGTGAISAAGARGLMQLMPSTAKAVAKQRGVAMKSSEVLNRDPDLNVSLGSHYLSTLLKRFDGSYAMAIAAYNAGPGRPARWAREYGDPRTREIDMLDWIERIPFPETRNYVQRVMEATAVYRYRLGYTQNAFRIGRDLGR